MSNTHTYYPWGSGGRQKAFLTTEAANREIPVEYFHETVTLTSAAANVAVTILSDARVGPGRKVYLQGGVAHVDGATPWGTVATVKVQDTNGTPVPFVTLGGTIATTLAANTSRFFTTDNAGSGNAAQTEDAFDNGTGGTLGKGIVTVADAAGTGSPLKVTVWGVIK